MVCYVIKLEENMYWCQQGPYGEMNISETPAGAQRFLKKKQAKATIYFKGIPDATIEKIEVPNV